MVVNKNLFLRLCRYTNAMKPHRTSYRHRSNLAKIQTPDQVIIELQRVGEHLPDSDLFEFVFFNRAYVIITKAIHQASDDGLFSDDKTMNQLEVAFAHKYFAALNSYVQAGSLPHSWKHVRRGLLGRHRPASLSLMLGAHAHINHDLLEALRAVIDNPSHFENDYFKVNQLLLASSKAISKSYYEDAVQLNFLKKHLRSLYLRPVMQLILHWRTRVWREFAKTA